VGSVDEHLRGGKAEEGRRGADRRLTESGAEMAGCGQDSGTPASTAILTWQML
jgi:hypothetical protein